MYTSIRLGKELKEKLIRQEDVVSIGHWAYSIYLDYDVDDSNLDHILLSLSAMSDDPQFVFSYLALHKIADDLIAGKIVDIDSEEYTESNPGTLTKAPIKIFSDVQIFNRNNKIITFGDKQKFAISYISYLDEYADDPDIINNPNEYIAGGNLYFWVKGKNLFAFKDWGDHATYGYPNLHSLVGFLSENLVHHITDTPFPVETNSTNAIDMIQEFYQNEARIYLDLNLDNIDVSLRKKIEDWYHCRSYAYNSGGSFLPNMYARRLGDQVEISWHNTYPHDDGQNKFYMLHTKGVEYIDAALYREVVTQFCLAYIDRIKEKEPENAERYRKNLRNAMRAPL